MKVALLGLAVCLLATGAAAQVSDDPTPEEFGAQAAQQDAVSQTTPAVVGQTYQIAPPELWLGTPSHSEYVSDYAGTSFRTAGMAVGRLTSNQPPTIPGQPGHQASCTAWLVARDLILTARHCVRGAPGSAPSGQIAVQFGFDYGTATSPSYAVSRIEEANDDLDYVLARVSSPPSSPAPGDLYGVIRVVADSEVRDREPLWIVHHANGDSQLLIKDGTCRRFAPDAALPNYLYHRCDTREGSSGAPVLSFARGYLPASTQPSETVAVALHIRGQSLDTAEDFKVATRLSAIVAVSSILKPLSCRWDAERWRCPSLSWPTSTLIMVPYGRSDYYLRQQFGPFGSTFDDAAVQAAFDQIGSNIPPVSPRVIRVRVLGDAALDDLDAGISSGSPVVAEALRRRLAYQRAEDVANHINRLIPLSRPAVFEVDYRRAEPGSDPRPHRPQVEVAIDFIY